MRVPPQLKQGALVDDNAFTGHYDSALRLLKKEQLAGDNAEGYHIAPTVLEDTTKVRSSFVGGYKKSVVSYGTKALGFF